MAGAGPPREQPLIIFMPAGQRGRVPAGTSLLDAARQVGAEIESICGGRLTCGKCKVHIEEGTFQKHGIVSGNGHLSPAGASRANVHMSSVAICALLTRAGYESVLQVSCRDRNRIAVQGDLLGAAAMGIRNTYDP